MSVKLVNCSLMTGCILFYCFVGPDDEEKFCINSAAFVLALIAITVALVTSASLTIIVTNKLMKRTEQLRKLTSEFDVHTRNLQNR